MGGQHQEWCCVGDAISRKTRSIIIRLNTYEDLWLRVSRKSVVAVPMEVAPLARSCRVKGQSTLNRMRQPQYNFTRFLIYFIRSCWREAYHFFNSVSASFFRTTFGAAVPNSQLFSKQTLFTRLTSMNSHFFLPSELSVKKLTISSQSSESRKIRGEADAISTQGPLLCLNSHIFFFVVDQRKRRQRQASKTADVCSAFEPQLPAKIVDVHIQAKYINSIVARS